MKMRSSPECGIRWEAGGRIAELMRDAGVLKPLNVERRDLGRAFLPPLVAEHSRIGVLARYTAIPI
jgi:hypothetical protein